MDGKIKVVERMVSIANRIRLKERDLAFLENTDVKHVNSITIEYIDESDSKMLGHVICPASNISDVKLVVDIIVQAYKRKINLAYEMLDRMAEELKNAP